MRRQILPYIICFNGCDILETGHNRHRKYFTVPHDTFRLPRAACSGIAMKSPCGFCLIFKFKINRRLIGKTYSGKHLHGLMILHHLHSTYIIVAYAIFPAEKIRTLDVEFVDILTLILNLSALCNINARHTLQHVANAAILSLREAAYIVCDGVALFTNAVSFHGNLLQNRRRHFHFYCQGKFSRIKIYGLLGKTHHSHVDSISF